MADYFKRLYALDISDDMIAYAAKNIRNPNVIFHTTSGDIIPVKDCSVNSVFSTHVFQHLESIDDASNYIREISRVLIPGGTMMVHLPVFTRPLGADKWVKRVYKFNKYLENIKAKRIRRVMSNGGSAQLMRMNSYPLSYFYTLLPSLKFRDIEVQIFVTNSNNAPHPFVLATKM